MIEVPKKQFMDKMVPLDVHPHSNWQRDDRGLFCVTEWKLQGIHLIGKDITDYRDDVLGVHTYFLLEGT